jgi:hypothetical protein
MQLGTRADIVRCLARFRRRHLRQFRSLRDAIRSRQLATGQLYIFTPAMEERIWEEIYFGYTSCVVEVSLSPIPTSQ